MSGSNVRLVQVEQRVIRSGGGAAVALHVQEVQFSIPGSGGRPAVCGDAVPSRPWNLRVSTKRTAQLIKIRWDKPQQNAHAVSHYEMQMRTKKTGWAEIATSTKCSAKATNLSADTKYFFRVRAVNGRGEPGDFSSEIEAETRFSKAARAVLSPLVFLGGTVAGPLIGAVGVGALAGVAASEKADSKAGAATAGAAAGVAGAAGGVVVGTLGAPLIGGAAAHMFVHGQSWSPQSSDDES